MNRLSRLALCVVWVACISFSAVLQIQAQDAPQSSQGQAQDQTKDQAQKSATPSTDKAAAKEDDDEDKDNPFAPEPAPALPPGMMGSDMNDPRAKLTPGLYDAGETSMGMQHLQLFKKPDAFQLGANDPDDPKVQKTIAQLGMGRQVLEEQIEDLVGLVRGLDEEMRKLWVELFEKCGKKMLFTWKIAMERKSLS